MFIGFVGVASIVHQGKDPDVQYAPPIPVKGPFHRVAVDVLQLPVTSSGNKYVVVFLDYMTKWVEAFPTSDQQPF